MGGVHIGNVWNKNNNYWAHVTGGDGQGPAVDQTQPGKVYMSANGGVSASNTYGDCNSYIASAGGVGTLSKLLIDPNDSKKVYYVNSNNIVGRYNSVNASWSSLFNSTALGVLNGTGITGFSIAKGEPNLMFAVVENIYPNGTFRPKKIFKSIDGSQNWIDITANFKDSGNNYYLAWGSALDVAIDPNDRNHILVAMGGFDGTVTQGINRVIESWDQGITWNTKSNGLPGFPINKILFQEGSNAVWVGTDVGVYYLPTTSATAWQCYNNSLPLGSVNDLKINYCKGKIIAAIRGRGVWQANLPTIPGNNIFQITGTNSPLNQVKWYGHTSINTNLEIMPNVKLILYGTLSMAQGKRIVVNPGAQLIMQPNSKITNNCGDSWEGIFVGGDINTPQSISSKGYVIMNGGTIEHAQNAITTALTDANNNILWNTFGGVIQANGAQFLNNRKSVQFLYYPGFNNQSYFNKCTFNTTQIMRDNMVPDNHISMWAVKNVFINGCYFGYNAGNAYPVGNRYSGIYSIDASYTIDHACNSSVSPCISYLNTKFENLNNGVYFTSTNRLQYPTVRNSTFLNNSSAGIRVEGTDYTEIINNTFTTADINNAHGIYLDQCGFYKVENNTLNGVTSFNLQTGIFINNSGVLNNQIYRNNFNNLYMGSAAIQNNGNGSPVISSGLQIKCSNYLNNSYDAVILGTTNFVGAIARDQGSNISPIGNKYNAICGNANKYYKNGFSPQIVNHFNNNNANMVITPQPACSTPGAFVSLILGPYNPANQCLPSPSSGGGSGTSSSQKMQAINQNLGNFQIQYSQKFAEYNQLIDGGSTTQVLSTINSNMSNGNLKNYLEQKSPFLSDAALTAYFAKSNVPNGHIKAIHNKNKPVNPQIMQQIESLNLPNGIIDNILDQQNEISVSEKTKLEADLNYLKSEITSLVSDKIRLFLTDSILQNNDSVTYILKNDPTRGHNGCAATLAYINKGDFSSAQNEINLMKSTGEMSSFCTFYETVIALNQATEKCYKLTTDQILKLNVEAIAQIVNDPLNKNAQALLTKVFNYDYPSLILYPDINNNRLLNESEINKGVIESALTNGLTVKMYPNPAKDYFITEIIGTTEKSEIAIFDMLGKQVGLYKIDIDVKTVKINTNELTQGVYTIALIAHNKQTMINNKLIIIK